MPKSSTMQPSDYDLMCEEIGMRNEDYNKAKVYGPLLQLIHEQLEDENLERWEAVATTLYACAFDTTKSEYFDKKRKCLWYLGHMGQEYPVRSTKYPAAQVLGIYFVLAYNRTLSIYSRHPYQPHTLVTTIDMALPCRRVRFLDIRRVAHERDPAPRDVVPAKHKALLRVMGWVEGGRQRRVKRELLKRRRLEFWGAGYLKDVDVDVGSEDGDGENEKMERKKTFQQERQEEEIADLDRW